MKGSVALPKLTVPLVLHPMNKQIIVEHLGVSDRI